MRAVWVIVWLALLIALWLINSDSSAFLLIAAILAGWRLLELFVTGLGTVLKQQQQIRARSLTTIAVYGAQLTFIFAILYHSLALNAFANESGPATRASDFIYISWSNITSLGNSGYAPTNSVARFLEVSTTSAGILLLGVLLAFGIDVVTAGSTDDGCPEVASENDGDKRGETQAPA